jgi:hypothetical protein
MIVGTMHFYYTTCAQYHSLNDVGSRDKEWRRGEEGALRLSSRQLQNS